MNTTPDPLTLALDEIVEAWPDDVARALARAVIQYRESLMKCRVRAVNDLPDYTASYMEVIDSELAKALGVTQ